MSGSISRNDAVEAMYEFVLGNLTGIDEVMQQDNEFHIRQDGQQVILTTTPRIIRPASGYIDDVLDDRRQGIAHGLLQVRSTTQYDGHLLRQAVCMVDGKNAHFRNKKNLTKFEQEVVGLYGAPMAYYNPQEDHIELIKLRRFYEVPAGLLNWQQYETEVERTRMRRQLHIHEALKESLRVIDIRDRIKGPFTLEVYERQSPRKVLMARIIPYAA